MFITPDEAVKIMKSEKAHVLRNEKQCSSDIIKVLSSYDLAIKALKVYNTAFEDDGK